MNASEIKKQLEDHDDRVAANGIEIRMLGSMDNEVSGGFVVFAIVVDGEVTDLYKGHEEDDAIDNFLLRVEDRK